MKRNDYLRWDDFFMGIAVLASKRSKDPNTQVGACIVDLKGRIIGVGYNGFPRGCSDDEFPWDRDKEPLNSKYLFICHAEMNAIMNSNRNDLDNCILYTTLFPCNECAKIIIQSGIKEIYYIRDTYFDKDFTVAAKKMFDASAVIYNMYKPKKIIKLE